MGCYAYKGFSKVITGCFASVLITSEVDVSNATALRMSGGNGPEMEGPEMAIDGKLDTKFLDFDGVGFELHFSAPTAIDAVSYITADDLPHRDPTSFLLEGFTNHWQTLAEATLSPPIARFQETEQIPVGVPSNESGS